MLRLYIQILKVRKELNRIYKIQYSSYGYKDCDGYCCRHLAFMSGRVLSLRLGKSQPSQLYQIFAKSIQQQSLPKLLHRRPNARELREESHIQK